MEMRVLLPENYDATHAPSGHRCTSTAEAASIEGGVDHWAEVVQHKNFIISWASITPTPDSSAARKMPSRAMKMLAAATRIDPQGLVIAGVSSGAYAITLNATGPVSNFSAMVIITGGMDMQAQGGRARPVLFLRRRKRATDQSSPTANRASPS